MVIKLKSYNVLGQTAYADPSMAMIINFFGILFEKSKSKDSPVDDDDF